MSQPSMRSFLIDNVRTRRQDEDRLRLSMAGGSCVRDLYYEATGAPAEEISDERLMKMAIGAALDEVALAKTDGLRAVAHQPVEIRLGDLVVRGSADLVILGSLGPILVSDLKVVGEGTWSRVKNKPKPEHRAQANLYAWGLSAPQWSVCYVLAGTGEIREHFGTTDAFEAKRDFGAFEEAAYWVRKSLLPPRPYEDFVEEDGTKKLARDQYPCRFCSHRTHCWKGESDEIAVPNAGQV